MTSEVSSGGRKKITSNNGHVQLDIGGNRILQYDGDKYRTLIGDNPGGESRLDISQGGTGVLEAANPDKVINMDQNVFKIVRKINTTIPSFTSGTSQANYSAVSVVHGQDNTPIVKVFVEGYIVDSSIALVASSYIPLPISTSDYLPANYYFPNNGASNYRQLGIVFAVDGSNIYIQAASQTSGSSLTMAAIPVVCYVLQETIA